MTWREYHQATKHTAQSLRRSAHVLEWRNMPDPFRHYEGAPLLDLPADPPAPGLPAYFASNAATLLSQILFYSAAISATKVAPGTGDRYALRVNPSSGNLHPTEFHFITRGLGEWPDGLYHYRPSSHMAEQRATGVFDLNLPGAESPIVFILTSIAWREAWKYRDRAYRYCLHDIGHAWQALALAARAAGLDSVAIGSFPDDQVSEACRLTPDEWPMLIVQLSGAGIPTRNAAATEIHWRAGQANQLSKHPISYPLIEGIHAATKLSGTAARWELAGSRALATSSDRNFGEVARTRRSALDFRGGAESMSLDQLMTALAAADCVQSQFIQLYLYVHRVPELDPGVYRYHSASTQMELIRKGDQRVAAAGLSLGQDLAGNACVAFSMIADIDAAVRAHGDRGYRYVHFEAGAIGQRLYLAAEAQGLAATGIGAFFDDEVHTYLNLSPADGQVIYHFAIGHPIPDPRLTEKNAGSP